MRIALLLFLLITGIGVGAFFFFGSSAQSAISSATGIARDQYDSAVLGIQETINPLITQIQTTQTQLAPVFEFANTTLIPVASQLASSSGVLEFQGVTIDPSKISESMNSLPSQSAKDALYGYCQAVVQEYESTQMIE